MRLGLLSAEHSERISRRFMAIDGKEVVGILAVVIGAGNQRMFLPIFGGALISSVSGPSGAVSDPRPLWRRTRAQVQSR
jgi:hypothetical protein